MFVRVAPLLLPPGGRPPQIPPSLPPGGDTCNKSRRRRLPVPDQYPHQEAHQYPHLTFTPCSAPTLTLCPDKTNINTKITNLGWFRLNEMHRTVYKVHQMPQFFSDFRIINQVCCTAGWTCWMALLHFMRIYIFIDLHCTIFQYPDQISRLITPFLPATFTLSPLNPFVLPRR